MTKRMLIDASHAEETRVVVLDGNRLEEFDLESANRRPLKGNIYLAKVVRVEPSLQAAFVEYGGNRHGFLAFGEIHPDYYQIPIADRQRLIEMQAAEAREEAEEEERQAVADAARAATGSGGGRRGRGGPRGEARASIEAAAATPEEAVPPTPPGALAPTPPGALVEETSLLAASAGQDAPEEGGAAEAAEAGPPAGTEGGPTAHWPAEQPEPFLAAAPPLAAAEDRELAAEDRSFAVDAPALVDPTPPQGTDAAPAPGADAAAVPDEMSAAAPGAADPAPPEAAMPAATAQAAEDPAHDQDSLPTAAATEAEAPAGAEPVTLARDAAILEPEAPSARPNGHAGDGFPGAATEEADAEDEEEEEDEPAPETLGGADEPGEEMARERRIPPRFLRHYKIQEVIRRRQIMLVQVVKEERGTKGAALTTYISLAGRFSVLMPNSPRGGGVSRKITSATDRKRLREAIDELGLPQGMSLIVRTAGAQRPKPEIKRDCEYLLRLWDNIRERTLASTAPALIYEEADLIKRSIRDVFSRDVEEILVEGEDAYQDAREFMRMLMPQHVRKIQLVREGGLFARGQVEAQLEAIHSPVVQLRSGGYIVINQTEALVAIDVNSGRATRDRHIEDTALRTNCEAADEIARQLRLRDLAGLIVIDFIDMESGKHDAMVERRLKEALKHDRARIQVGRISHFGLLEMSRQRLRPSLGETAFVVCPHCQGRGTVRSVESSALMVLRAVEDEAARRRAAELTVNVATPVALYLLNRKRDRLAQIEARFGVAVLFEPDDELTGAGHRIERTRAADPNRVPVDAAPAALRMDYAPEPDQPEVEEEPVADLAPPEEEEEAAAEDGARGHPAQARTAEGDAAGDGGKRRRRRRRRRGGPRGEGAAAGGPSEENGLDGEGEEDEEEAGAEEAAPAAATEPPVPAEAQDQAAAAEEEDGAEAGRAEDGGARRRRRRGRGGRPPRPEAAEGEAQDAPQEPAPPLAATPAPRAPRYVGPTPADPFAGQVDDIYAAMEAAEAALEAAAAAARNVPPRSPAVTEAGAPTTARDGAAGEEVAGTALPGDAAPPVDEVVAIAAAAVVVVAEAAPGSTVAEAEPGSTVAEAAPESIVAEAAPEGAPGSAVAEAAPEPTAADAAPEPAQAEAVPETVPAAAADTAPDPSAAAGMVEPGAAAADAPAAVPDGAAKAASTGNGAAAPDGPPGPVQGPPVQPKLIGEAPVEAPRRSGWWRR